MSREGAGTACEAARSWWPSMFPALVFLLAIVSPSTNELAHGLKTAWAAFAVWMTVAYLEEPRAWSRRILPMVRRYRFALLMLVSWLGVVALNTALGRGQAGPLHMTNMFTMTMGVGIALFYSTRDDHSYGTLVAALAAILAVDLARSLPVLMMRPQVAREVTGGLILPADVRRLALKGVGEYQLYTGLAMVAPMMFARGVESDGLRRGALLGALGLTIIAVSSSMFVTATMLLLLGLTIVAADHIWRERDRLPFGRVMLGLVPALTGWFSSPFGRHLFDKFAYFSWCNVLYLKTASLNTVERLRIGLLTAFHGLSNSGGQVASNPTVRAAAQPVAKVINIAQEYGTDVSQSRTALYLMSFLTFLKHPLFGVGPSTGQHTAQYLTAIGGHSSWLDALAEYGLLGFGFYIAFWVAILSRALDGESRRLRLAKLTSGGLFILGGALDPVLSSPLMMVMYHVVATGSPANSGSGQVTTPFGASAAERGRPRVLFVHQVGCRGGSGTMLVNTIKSLDKSRVEALVVCPAGDLVPLLEAAGAKVHIAPRTLWQISHASGLARPAWHPRVLQSLIMIHSDRHFWTDYFRQAGADVVCLDALTLAPMAWSVRRAGAKAVCQVQETFVRGALGFRTTWLKWMLSHWMDAVVFIAEHERRVAGCKAPVVEVIPNWVDLTDFNRQLSQKDARNTLDISPSAQVVLFMGGISELKGTLPLLKAFALLEDLDNITLLIAGYPSEGDDGLPRLQRLLRWVRSLLGSSYEMRVRRLLSDERLGQKVRLVGMRDDVQTLYAAADVVAFPSASPHQARPVLEAGAMGKPVVISDFVQTREFVVDGVNGLTVSPRDPASLAAALRRLLADPVLAARLGEANYQATRERHDGAVNARKMAAVFEHLLQRDRGCAAS